jgi:hypothetical protein
MVECDQKLNQCVAFMLDKQPCKMLVYFNTCAEVDYFVRVLEALRAFHKHTVLALHGKIAAKVRAP